MRPRLRKQPMGTQGVRAATAGASTRPGSRAVSAAAEAGTPSVARRGRHGAPRSHLPNQRAPGPGPRAARGPPAAPACQPRRTERRARPAPRAPAARSLGARVKLRLRFGGARWACSCISNRLPSRGPARIALRAPVAGASKQGRGGEVRAGSEAVAGRGHAPPAVDSQTSFSPRKWQYGFRFLFLVSAYTAVAQLF